MTFLSPFLSIFVKHIAQNENNNLRGSPGAVHRAELIETLLSWSTPTRPIFVLLKFFTQRVTVTSTFMVRRFTFIHIPILNWQRCTTPYHMHYMHVIWWAQCIIPQRKTVLSLFNWNSEWYQNFAKRSNALHMALGLTQISKVSTFAIWY